jgi:sulfoxide reductase heme-binding subunit YedZ
MNSIAAPINATLRRLPIWPLYIIAFMPMGWYFYLGLNNQLGADPVKALEHFYGLTALQFLIATLCVTPILRLTRINLVRFRRMIGLMAFWYALAHFAVYLFLDLQLLWGQIWSDLTKRPYIMVGTAALLMLIPLALTSNDWSLRRMGGAAWRKLHMLVYPAAILGAVHFVWLVKAWPPEPLVYLGIVLVLLGFRAVIKIRRRMPAGRARTA